MAELGGMLAAAILKVVSDQIGSAIGGRIKLQQDFSKDLEKMKMTLESVEALLDDAERQSVTDKSTRLWLKRLKEAMYGISDMIDEFEADMEAVTQPSKRKLSLREHLSAMIPCIPTGPKITLAYKMKLMRENLEEITGEHKNFHLVPHINGTDLDVIDKRETSSNMDTLIVGRAGERDMILSSLSESIENGMMILSIYGIGGLGKTTLAQMVYNSSQFKDYSQVWVYVSQTFDLKKIGNSIITQLLEKENESPYTEMQMIHNCLSKLLVEKKILIVLDDLWEDNKSHLNKLKVMLHVGKGSKVIVVVTTRYEGIAKEMSTVQPHKLALLTNDMCWSIIKHKSDFKSRNDKNELKKIGKDIARNCGGVVLAAQSLGYMLQTMTPREWQSVRDSGIWSLSDSEESSLTHVLASLRLSYGVMSSYLKLCFAYCAIFPKGHKIVKDELIHQWASLGFIEPTNVSSSWELGERYIRQLLGLSFLQDLKVASTSGVNIDDVTLYTMHDLVHDLARSIMVDEIFVASNQNLVHALGSNYHYALLNDCSKPLESSKIRALRFMECREIILDGASFSFAKALRILDLSECSIHKLPDSIGVLKQLRYLNAPRIQDRMISDSITMLSKLTYLNLHGSSAVIALPESIGDIEGLLYIDLSGCSRIEKLPESFGRLKKLVHLNLSNCSRVGDVSKFLGSLKELQYLNLSHCPHIGELPKELGGLSELQYMNVSFSSYLQCCQEADVLGTLTKLQYLNLSSECCDLRRLPEDFSSFIQLKYLNLSGCRHMEELPVLFGNLKNLVHLDLSNCLKINDLSVEAFGGLTNLQYLNLSLPCHIDYQHLTKLPEVIGNLRELRYLNLSGCIDSMFDSYWWNRSRQTNSFINRISALSNLEHLDLSHSDLVSSIPASFCNLKRLHTLALSGCTSLKKIPESIGRMNSLKFLYVSSVLEQPQLSSNAISLPHFEVKADDGESSSSLIRLQNVNPVALEITGLENTMSIEEADCIKLLEKQQLEYLSLQWTRDAERYVDDKMLLENLVPPSSSKQLVIRGYRSDSFPAWLMDSTHYLPNIVRMNMCGLPKCNSLPPIDQLPNLKYVFLSDMASLEEWNTSYSSGQGCVIERLEIHDCPKLRIKPLPPRAKWWTISSSDSVLSSWGEYTSASTSSSYPINTALLVEHSEVPMHQWRLLQHLPGITSLWLNGCADLTGSPDIIQHLSSLKSVKLQHIDQQELTKWLDELTSILNPRMLGYSALKELHESMALLTRLQPINPSNCDSLTSLPHWLGELISLEELEIWDCDAIRSLPKGIRQLTKLQKLEISRCPELKNWNDLEESQMKFTPNQDRACVLPTSLKELVIIECDGISSLPEGIQQLTNLQRLAIGSCPALQKWCESEENKTKLAHIKEQVSEHACRKSGQERSKHLNTLAKRAKSSASPACFSWPCKGRIIPDLLYRIRSGQRGTPVPIEALASWFQIAPMISC